MNYISKRVYSVLLRHFFEPKMKLFLNHKVVDAFFCLGFLNIRCSKSITPLNLENSLLTERDRGLYAINIMPSNELKTMVKKLNSDFSDQNVRNRLLSGIIRLLFNIY